VQQRRYPLNHTRRASAHLATDLGARRIILDLNEGHDRLARLAELRAVQRDNGCFALDSPSVSPTACRPSAGARASRAYAAPSPAARACGQSSAPAGIRTAGGDADINGAVAGHPATNRNAAGAIDDTVADLDAEAGVGIAAATLRHDLHRPATVEMICTVQPPSNDVRACAVPLAAGAAIATVTRVQAIGTDSFFMVANLYKTAVLSPHCIMASVSSGSPAILSACTKLPPQNPTTRQTRRRIQLSGGQPQHRDHRQQRQQGAMRHQRPRISHMASAARTPGTGHHPATGAAPMKFISPVEHL
jgi:hypothetical protein